MTNFPAPPFRDGSFQGPPRPPSLVRNTTFNLVASIVNLGVVLVVAPVLLATLGLQGYGLWSLLWAITGSLGLLDLRTSAALTPLAATALAREEHDRVARLLTTGLTFYAALGLLEVGAALLWVRVPNLMAWVPEPFGKEAHLAFVVAVAVFAINSVTTVFTGLLQAFQRFDLSARIAMVVTVFRGTILVAVAWGGGGLRELVLAEGSVACLQWMISAWVVQRLLPELRVFGRPDPSTFRELITFGGKLQIAHIAHLISLHADKLLLSAFLGLTAVAYYDLGQKIAYLMRRLPLLLISATMPVVSTMEATGDRERLWNFYLKCMRMVVFAATPLLIFTVTGAREILTAWVGIAPPEARQTVCLLALGYYVYLVSVMSNYVSVGMGKPELEMRRSLLTGALNIGLSVSLIPLIGFAGAPLGTALALAAGSGYLIRMLNIEFGRPPSDVLGLFYRPALAGLLASAGAILVLWMASGEGSNPVFGLADSALLIGAVFLWRGIRDEVLTREWLKSVPARLRHPAMKP